MHKNLSDIFPRHHRLLHVCQQSDSKTFQKVHLSCIKTRSCLTFSIFRLIWCLSGVFLKQNAATYSSNNVLHSFRYFVLTVLQLITKALGNCTEIASKRQKLQIYRHFLSQFEAFFFKLDLSLKQSSLKR